MRKTMMSVVCAAIALLPPAAHSAAYPEKPIRLVVPFAPGGGVDTIARLILPKLTEALGQQVVVDNRGGASGNIGSEIVARSVPDGYTLLIHTLPFVTNTFLYSRMPYDPVRDFAPISLLTAAPSVLTVHPSLPVRSIGELLKLARAKPGALNYASAGTATNPHVAGELFNHLGKVNIVAVHYKGAGPGLVATISGEVAIAFSNIVQTSELVRAKRLRALGVTSAKRSQALPDVPTIAESGLPGYEFVTWNGILAPKATPAAVVAFLNERIRKTIAIPEVTQRLQQDGLEVGTSSPEEFEAHIKSELAKWGSVVKARNMRAD
ncbi:MAG: tripartite tricarboxylate transporter substrate binding protein [Burkholderiales bacterium]